MLARSLAGAALAVVVVLGASSTARAAGSAADREAARSLAERGFDLYQKGDCKGARASFEQAEQHFHAPPHLLFIARCDAKLGQLLAARTFYKRIVAEQLPPDAPAPFRDAQTSAKSELDEIEIRLPTLQVALAQPAPGATVAIDGQPLAAGEIGKPRPLDPGHHVVTATAPDHPGFQRAIDLRDGGGAARIDIDFGGAAAGGAQGGLLPAIIALSVGGAGVVVGSITGVASLNQVGHLNDVCVMKHCAADLKSTADSASTLGTVSTVAFVVGGLGLATGATLFVVRPRFGHASDASARLGPADVKLALGPGSVRVLGTF